MDGYGFPSSKKRRVPYHMVMITFIQKVVLLWYLIKMVLVSNETSSKKQGILIEFSWQYKAERERERLTFLNSKGRRAERAEREIDGVGVLLGVKNNEEKGLLYSFSSVHMTHRNLWNQPQHLTVYTSLSNLLVNDFKVTASLCFLNKIYITFRSKFLVISV